MTEAERLAQPERFDYIHPVGDNYATIRRYAPQMLNVFRLQATPAARDVVDALDTLRALNTDGGRALPAYAPTDFIRRRWQGVVIDGLSLDRRFYEICALAELRDALRSWDVWVQSSRQFKAFGEYLVSDETYSALRDADSLQLAVATDRDMYLDDRFELVEVQLATVNRMTMDNALPDAVIDPSGLKITPLDSAVPDKAQGLIDRTAKMLPHVKITEILMDVDEWTGFSRYFTHLQEPVGVTALRATDKRRRTRTPSVSEGPRLQSAELRRRSWLDGRGPDLDRASTAAPRSRSGFRVGLRPTERSNDLLS